MKDYQYILLFILVIFVSCNSKDSKKDTEKDTDTAVREIAKTNKGYELMKQRCFICHLEKPDPSSKIDQMIAPPMMRVQEHYKPSYPEKEAFVKAVMAYVNNPSQEKTLMPGAVKKFNLMPKVIYDQNELRTIVEALYHIDLGSMPDMHRKRGKVLQLNNGGKWKIKTETKDRIQKIIKELDDLDSEELSDYNRLGKEIFEDARTIILDKDYKGELSDQIQFFFGGVENNIHTLISTNSLGVAKKQLEVLKIKFDNFNKYFE